jgi:hypothetical protein
LKKAKILIYGPPKIGKTTLASQWPRPLFLATEEGQDWVEDILEPVHIDSWDLFLNVCHEISEAHPDHFDTIVIDTVDLLFKMCLEDTCTSAGISHPADLDWGKGWNLVGSEWERVITKLARICSVNQYGLILISHATEREVKSKARKIDKTSPTLMQTGFRAIHALVDIIMYCHMDEVVKYDDNENPTEILEERRIACAPKDTLIAGDRTGLLPEDLPMSYEEVAKYFPDT